MAAWEMADVLHSFADCMQQINIMFEPELRDVGEGSELTAEDMKEYNYRSYVVAYAEILASSVGVAVEMPAPLQAVVAIITTAQEKERPVEMGDDFTFPPTDFTAASRAMAEILAIEGTFPVNAVTGLFATQGRRDACVAELNAARARAVTANEYDSAPEAARVMAAMNLAAGLPNVDDPEFVKDTAAVFRREVALHGGPIDFSDVSTTFFPRFTQLMSGLADTRGARLKQTKTFFTAKFDKDPTSKKVMPVSMTYFPYSIPAMLSLNAESISRGRETTKSPNPPIVATMQHCAVLERVGIAPYGITGDGRGRSGHALVMMLTLDPDTANAYALEVRVGDPNKSSLQVAEHEARQKVNSIRGRGDKANNPGGWCQTFSWFEGECAIMRRSDIHGGLVGAFTDWDRVGRRAKAADAHRPPEDTMAAEMIRALVPLDEQVIGCRVRITGNIVGHPTSRPELEATAVVRTFFRDSDRRKISGLQNATLAETLNGKTGSVIAELPASPERVNVSVGGSVYSLKIANLTGVHEAMAADSTGEIVALGRDGDAASFMVRLHTDSCVVEVPVASVDILSDGQPAYGNVLSYLVKALAVRYRVLHSVANRFEWSGNEGSAFSFPYMWAAANRERPPRDLIEAPITGDRETPAAKLMEAVMQAYLDKTYTMTTMDYPPRAAFVDTGITL